MKKIAYFVLAVVLLLFGGFSVSSQVSAQVSANEIYPVDLNDMDINKINNMVNNVMKKSKIPGVSIVIVSGNQTQYLSYGYADKEQNIYATPETLFELGSMSKAFTGLGILLLEDEGKISLDDPITKYIPWLTLQYKGTHNGIKMDGEVELKISDFLYQTSGIPFKTIGSIPQGTSDSLLEETVKTLIGTQLDFYPGDRYQYATINYDVLGYVIQLVSGHTYEDFIKERIIKPLELNNTYLFQDEAQATGFLAQGYKMNFFQSKIYNAPRYRGNTPAGYIISNAKDMERWMKIQMGMVETSEQFQKIIKRSHVGNTTVASQSNYQYAVGWHSHIKELDINHGGSNPNYSSMMILQSNEDFGICVLSNLNSNAAGNIAVNIQNILQQKDIIKYRSDLYTNMDTIFSIVVITAMLLGLLFLALLVIAIIDLIRKKRIKEKLKGAKVAGLLLAIPIMIFMGFCIYYLPNILFQRLNWKSVNVWGSSSVMTGCILGIITFTIFMAYVLFIFNFPKENEKGYMALIPLSLINGFSSALIIFTINESFNRNLEYSKELLVYFIFSLLFFVYTIKLLQGRMIVITNEITYEKRINMIDKIMCSSYQAIEEIGRDRIFSGLNNDCTALAKVPGMIVMFVSHLLTLIFCLSYLLTKSIWAFIASLGIILINGLVSFITSRIASKSWEENRDIQDIYFGQMQDLVNGFKELVLNKLRRYAFWLDMKKYSRISTELNKAASIKFLNFGLYSTLMYNIVFGVVVFGFPIFILNLDVNQLRENLFIVFYMIGPFGAVAGVIPQLTQLNINIKRINKLIADLDEVSTGDETIEQKINISYPKDILMQFEDVVYKYISKNKDGEKEESEFTLGPINTEFKSGEIVFITGGNGSGKSTLGKLITGLYQPQEGKIIINGKDIKLREQNELFSSVYSDFNLFKKLYGIDYQQKKEMITKYLNMMKIKDKVEINNEGEFKSIDLSTGQKKRLALVISCLEEKPMMLLDEWAAEQDPGFRAYFYDEFLPILKSIGMCVIVITHDDRYFHKADKIIKLERGALIPSDI